MGVFMVLFAVIVQFATNTWTNVAFLVGALTSILSGWIGMKVAVLANVRCTYETWQSLPRGFDLAVRGGSVMGLSLVSFGTLVLYGLITVYRMPQYYGTN